MNFSKNSSSIIISIASLLVCEKDALAVLPVPVGPATTQTFTADPATVTTTGSVLDWTTNNVTTAVAPLAGGGGQITDDTTFNTAVSQIASTDMTSGFVSATASGTNGRGKWRSDLQYAVTQPTAVSYNTLLANLSNSAAVPLTGVSVTWKGGVELPASVTTASSDNTYLNGHRLFYSTTGLVGSFLQVGLNLPDADFIFPSSTTATPFQTWNVAINFPTAVAPGAPFYLLWADDNALTNNDGAYYIDDVQIVGIPEPTSVVSLLGGIGLLTLIRRRR